MDQDDKAFTECTPEAFRHALHYLYEEAIAMGWIFPAHFIAVAAEAMRAYEPMTEKQAKPGVVIPFSRPDPHSGDAEIDRHGQERGRW